MLLSVSLATACREKPFTPQTAAAADTVAPARETFALGTQLTAEGAVAEDAQSEEFKRGGPIYLSVDVAGRSTQHTIEVEWRQGNRVVKKDVKAAVGSQPYVPFALGETHRWPAGRHQAVVIIDGRRVAIKDFALI